MPSLSKVRRVAIVSIFGVVIFASKLIIPTPIDKAFIIIQALLLTLSSLQLRMGATHVAIISGLLTTVWRPVFAPFSLIFAIMYGILIDVFLHLFKVRMPHGNVKTGRVVLSLTLSTAIVGLLALYVTVMVGLMPTLPILYLTIIILGVINGAVAGYFASFIWNRYSKYFSS